MINIDDAAMNAFKVVPKRHRALALGVWIQVEHWSATHGEDGFVPRDIVTQFGGAVKISKMIEETGLWIVQGNEGVKLASAERHALRRSENALRSRRYRDRKKKCAEQLESPSVTHDDLVTDCDGRANQSNQPTKVTLPLSGLTKDTFQDSLSLVLPVALLPKPGTTARRAKRRPDKHPLPDDWMPSLDTLSRMQQKYPHLDLKGELEAFTHHHKAHGKVMSSWSSAFWTWLGNTGKFGPNGNGVALAPKKMATSDQRVIEVQSLGGSGMSSLRGMMSNQKEINGAE